MVLLCNIINFIKHGVIIASTLDTKYEQREYLKNHIMMTKYIMGELPYLKRVKSLEFKFEEEKYVEEINCKPRRSKSLCVRIFSSNCSA